MGPAGQSSIPTFFLDPREIVLMFKDLHEGSFAMAAHIKYPPVEVFKTRIQNFKMQHTGTPLANFQEADSILEAKKQFLSLFELIN
jgi:hypothetical protein